MNLCALAKNFIMQDHELTLCKVWFKRIFLGILLGVPQHSITIFVLKLFNYIFFVLFLRKTYSERFRKRPILNFSSFCHDYHLPKCSTFEKTVLP